MTPGQQRALDYIREYIKTKGHSPSYTEIMSGLGLHSRGGVHSLVHSLIGHGKLRMIEGANRSLEVVDDAPALADRLAKALVTDHGVYEDDVHDEKLIIATPAEARATLLAALRA